MTDEISYYWNNPTGDGVFEPYSANIWSGWWRKLFTSYSADEGYIENYLDELEVVGNNNATVNVGAGAALVDGTLYKNPTMKTVVLDIPAANPRIDVIVLCKCWNTKTIRITYVQGTEAGVPVAPTWTNLTNFEWRIPLANVQVETDASVSVTDRREKATSPLMLGDTYGSPAWELKETVTAPGGGATMQVQNWITATTSQMWLIGRFRNESIVAAGSTSATITPEDATQLETVGFDYYSLAWRGRRNATPTVIVPHTLNSEYNWGHMRMRVWPAQNWGANNYICWQLESFLLPQYVFNAQWVYNEFAVNPVVGGVAPYSQWFDFTLGGGNTFAAGSKIYAYVLNR